jgi:flagellar protein FliO/FliZ
MDTVDPARFIFASFFVLGLLGLLAIGLKHYGQKSFGKKIFTVSKTKGRVTIVETQYIDHKSKLILIKRDDVEHLLLVGDGKATIIESGIKHDA